MCSAPIPYPLWDVCLDCIELETRLLTAQVIESLYQSCVATILDAKRRHTADFLLMIVSSDYESKSQGSEAIRRRLGL